MPRPVVPIALAPLRPLARTIERDVRGQDQRAVGADAQPFVDGHALLHERVRLAKQRVERQHDAVADQALHAADAGCPDGNQREHRLHAVDYERMAGVVPALESRHRADALGEQVDDLALAFVAPLGADDD